MSIEGKMLTHSALSAMNMDESSLQSKDEGEIEDGELIEEDNSSPIMAPKDKLSERAKRFGLQNPPSKTVDPSLEKFHKRMGVDIDTRTEALHLYGTDNMKTQDIFGYFNGNTPSSIEWITDKSCNAVWFDEVSCAKAFKDCSLKIKGLVCDEAQDDSEDGEESVKTEDIRCALPPGNWRKGRSTVLAPSLFVRYAKRSDRKGMKPPITYDNFGRGMTFLDEGDEVAKKIRSDSSNPWVDIAKQWNYFENKSSYTTIPSRPKDARQILSHRKPNYRDYRSSDRIIPEVYRYAEKVPPESRSLPVRKMRADIEERKLLARNKRTDYQVTSRRFGDLRERLGRKRKLEEEEYDDEDDNLMDENEDIIDEQKQLNLRIEIDNSKATSEDEWEECNSAASADSDEVQVRSNVSDLRSKLRKCSPEKEDKTKCVKSILRTKPVKCRKTSYSPLRIEIDNDNYNRSDESD